MGNDEQARKHRALREIGKVSINFGNLTFASLVLGTIIKGDYDQVLLLVAGGVIAFIFIALGVVTLAVAGGER